MNRPLSLLFGVVAAVVLSLVGLVVLPSWQYGAPTARRIEDATGIAVMYPPELNPIEERGRNIYKAEGCIYCHSQQVRPEGFGVDLERALGSRRSVPLDYVRQSPPLLGSMRTGPDLSNIATRQPSDAWHHLHFFDARIVSPGSIMPPFRYFYEVVKRDPQDRGYPLPDDYYGHKAWIIPTDEGRALFAYTQALHQDFDLQEVQ